MSFRSGIGDIFAKLSKGIKRSTSDRSDGDEHVKKEDGVHDDGERRRGRFFGLRKGKGGLSESIGDIFGYKPQVERVLKSEDFARVGDTYYATVSAAYKVAERFLWLILAVFLTFSVITNYRVITYDNFFYLIRDFSTAAESRVANYQTLSYDSDSRQNFELFRGGIVSASPSSVSIFTAGGRRTLRSNNDFASPRVICCDKYVIVYDMAAASFSVYNSHSKIYSEKLDSPIVDACFNNGGAFAVATRGEGRNTIYLYSDDIKLRGKIPIGGYMIDMTLDSSAKQLAALMYQGENGVMGGRLRLYDVKNSTEAGMTDELLIDGEFPIGCVFLEGGDIALLTDSAVRIYRVSSGKLEIKESELFAPEKLSAFDLGAQGIAVVSGDGIRKRIISFDKKGKMLYNSSTTENVLNLGVCDGFIFLQTSQGIIRIDPRDLSEEMLESSGGKMLLYDRNTAIVCGEAMAEYLVFKKR